jgi:hypothetical protein
VLPDANPSRSSVVKAYQSALALSIPFAPEFLTAF